MITSLEPKIDLSKDVLAYTIDTNIKTPDVGEKVKLYIPMIMANIPQEQESKVYKVSTNGQIIFKNSPECMPSVKMMLDAQNYIEAECENNTNWDGADVVQLSSSGSVKSRSIKGKTKVNATFTNGKFKAITFNTCKYVSDSINDKRFTSTSRYSGDVQLSNIKETISNIESDHISIDLERSTEIEVPDVNSINNTINSLSKDIQMMQKTINILMKRLESTNTISVNQLNRW